MTVKMDSIQGPSIDERQFHHARQQDQPYVPNHDHGLPKIEHETPVLVVGGGPVGMYLSIMLGHQNCILVEQYPDTTIYPKM